MASIRSKNGILQLVYWDKTQKKNRERSLKLRDDPEGWAKAKQELELYKAKDLLGLNRVESVSRSVTLSGARDYYLEYKGTGLKSVSKSTIDALNYGTKKIIECLGNIDLGTLDKKRFDYFASWLKKQGLSTNSINFITSHLLPAYLLCKRDDLTSGFYFYATPKEEKRPEAIPPEHLSEILQGLKASSPDAHDFFKFLHLSGFRKSSALALTWDMVDMKKRIITVPNIKAKRKSDLFPIGRELFALLAGLRKLENGKVFKYIDKRFATWDRVVKRLNDKRVASKLPPMPKYTIHQLRKTFLSELINRGLTFEDVSYLAGHRDPRTTRRHYLQQDINKLRVKIDGANSRPGLIKRRIKHRIKKFPSL